MHSPSQHPKEPGDGGPCIRTALALGFRDGVLHAEAKDMSQARASSR